MTPHPRYSKRAGERENDTPGRFQRSRINCLLSDGRANPTTELSINILEDPALPSKIEAHVGTEHHSTGSAQLQKQCDDLHAAPPRPPSSPNPKTPKAQIRRTPSPSLCYQEVSPSWFRQTGPGQSCSDQDADVCGRSPSPGAASDSSISTCRSRHSLLASSSGSSTSTDNECEDPFLPSLGASSKHGKTSASAEYIAGDSFSHEQRRCSFDPVAWSPEMDNHLWDTFNKFLQDPTITPFKLFPGNLPPLGISYRVAREARRTWSRNRPQTPLVRNTGEFMQSSVTTPRTLSSLSKTLASAKATETQPWPFSDESTRRRLKMLCKHKSSIKRHYQRLIRSPSLEETELPSMKTRQVSYSLADHPYECKSRSFTGTTIPLTEYQRQTGPSLDSSMNQPRRQSLASNDTRRCQESREVAKVPRLSLPQGYGPGAAPSGFSSINKPSRHSRSISMKHDASHHSRYCDVEVWMQHRKAMSFNNGRLRPQVSSTKQGQEPLAAFFPQGHDLAMRDEAVPRSKNISSFRRGYSSMKQVHDVAQSFPGSNFPFSPDDGDGDDVFSNHEGTPGLEAPPPASPFSFSLPSPKQLGFRHDSFPEGRKRRGTSIGSFSTRTEAANRSYQDQLHRSSLSSATETRRTAR